MGAWDVRICADLMGRKNGAKVSALIQMNFGKNAMDGWQ
jgi:hypothetical protein